MATHKIYCGGQVFGGAANVSISKQSGNAAQMKSDGIYVPDAKLRSIDDIYFDEINNENHLLIKMTDGTIEDAGIVPANKIDIINEWSIEKSKEKVPSEDFFYNNAVDTKYTRIEENNRLYIKVNDELYAMRELSDTEYNSIVNIVDTINIIFNEYYICDQDKKVISNLITNNNFLAIITKNESNYYSTIMFENEVGYEDEGGSDLETEIYQKSIKDISIREMLDNFIIDLELNPSSPNAISNAAVADALNGTMSYNNPRGYGSFSMNRKSGTGIGSRSTTIGYNNTATGPSAHAEGDTTQALNMGAHSEGCRTIASGWYSHAEGNDSKALGHDSHAEGLSTETDTDAWYSHTEGHNTKTFAYYAHAEGGSTEAKGQYSHAEGLGTIAFSENQHAEGKYNIEDTEGKYLHIIGNGTSNESRSNAYTLDLSGNATFAGTITIGNTTITEAQLQALLALL